MSDIQVSAEVTVLGEEVPKCPHCGNTFPKRIEGRNPKLTGWGSGERAICDYCIISLTLRVLSLSMKDDLIERAFKKAAFEIENGRDADYLRQQEEAKTSPSSTNKISS